MGQFGTYWETQILKHIVGLTSLTQQTYYVAACTAAPMTAAGTNLALAECEATNTGSYARIPIYTANWTTVSGSSPAVVRNSAKITWATATLNWGTITYIAILNTASVLTGEVLAWGACTNTAVTTGDTLSLGTQSLTLQIT